MKQLNSSKVYILVFIWTLSIIAAVILSHLVPISTPLTPIEKKSYSHHHYVGRNSLSEPIPVCHEKKRLIDNFAIGIRFRIFRYAEYANIFQTASFNEGIRLELFKASDQFMGLLLVLGNNEAGQPMAIKMNREIVVNKNYTLKILIDSWKNVKIYLDNELMQVSSMNAHPILSDVVVGNGFDGKRPFWGEIDLDQMDVAVSDYVYNASSKGFISKVLNRLHVKNYFDALGLLLFLVNFSVAFRLFYYVWYES